MTFIRSPLFRKLILRKCYREDRHTLIGYSFGVDSCVRPHGSDLRLSKKFRDSPSMSMSTEGDRNPWVLIPYGLDVLTFLFS